MKAIILTAVVSFGISANCVYAESLNDQLVRQYKQEQEAKISKVKFNDSLSVGDCVQTATSNARKKNDKPYRATDYYKDANDSTIWHTKNEVRNFYITAVNPKNHRVQVGPTGDEPGYGKTNYGWIDNRDVFWMQPMQCP